jgi:ankyrin repeat protein
MEALKKPHLATSNTPASLRAQEMMAQEQEGCTAVWVAASQGHTDAVHALCAAPPAAAAPAEGEEAAAEEGRQPGDVNAANNHGRTPIMGAAINGHVDTVQVRERQS